MVRGGDSTQNRARFITGFIGFRLRYRIQNNPGTGLYGGNTVFHEGGANDNTGIQIAMSREVTYCAAVATTATTFCLGAKSRLSFG